MIWTFAWSLVSLFAPSLIGYLARSLVRTCARLLMRLLARSLLRSFAPSLLRSFARCFIILILFVLISFSVCWCILLIWSSIPMIYIGLPHAWYAIFPVGLASKAWLFYCLCSVWRGSLDFWPSIRTLLLSSIYLPSSIHFRSEIFVLAIQVQA